MKSRRLFSTLYKYILFLGGLFFLFPKLQSQTLAIKEWVNMVRNNHPFITVADLQEDMARASYLKAKGNFDPNLNFDWNQKNFEQKNYYSLANGDISIPTAIGLRIKSGYEINRGFFVNPESQTPGNGLLFFGASLPLGRGLLIDEPRALLKQSAIGINIGKFAKLEDYNHLIYRAILLYLDWFEAYFINDLVLFIFKNAEERKDAIKVQVASGDRPGLDTTEANIQWQQIFLLLQHSELQLKNAETILNTFVWENGVNKNLEPSLRPEQPEKMILEMPVVENFLDLETFQKENPFLELYQLKAKQLEIDRQLKLDKLKPELNIYYNPIFEPISTSPSSNLTLENNKMGLSFRMPLFLRKERGDIQLSEIKIAELDAIWKEKVSTLYGKYNVYTNEWVNTRKQIEIFNQTVEGYRKMYEAEKRLFLLGESSLFLVNTREQTYLQNMVKRLELFTKNIKVYYGFHYVSGRLPSLFE